MANPTITAPRDRRMRQRSSSRWSRNGISPGEPVMGRWRSGLAPERLQSVTGERRFVGLRVLLYHPLVGVLRLGELFPPLGEETEVVERRGSPRGGRILVRHLAVVLGGGVGVL